MQTGPVMLHFGHIFRKVLHFSGNRVLFLHKLIRDVANHCVLCVRKTLCQMKLWSVICIIVVSAVLSAVHVHAQPDVGAYIVDAAAKVDAGDYAGAEEILGKVLAAAPSNDAALYYMAMCRLALKQTDQAEHYLIQAITADPSNFWYRQRLASIYAATGRNGQAMLIYEKLLSDFPKKTELYFNLTELYIVLGEDEKALNTLKEVETVIGMTESIAIYRYNLLLKTGKKEEAYRSLEEYNSRYSSPVVLCALAEHQLSGHEYSAALTYYDEALELEPGFSPALLGKAEVLRMTRRYDEYFTVLDQYMADPQESPEAKADYLSEVVRRTGRRAVMSYDNQFRALLAMMMETHPESVIAAKCHAEYLMHTWKWEDLSHACMQAFGKFPSEIAFQEMACIGDYRLKDYDKVLATCDMILENAAADSTKVLNTLAMKGDVYHLTGRRSKAYKSYEKALKLNPDYAYVLNNYAYYLSIEGRQLKKACEMSRKTIEAEPDNATYLDTYGWILFLMGRPEEARSHFKRAMMYGGNDSAVVLDHYAEVLFSLGEYDRAMVYWNKAMNINNGEIKDLEERINARKRQREDRK